MSKSDLIKLDVTTELMKISTDTYRYVNSQFTKPTAKLSDHTTDIKLKVEKEYFKAHKDVLSSASDYFSAMFNHDMAEKGKDYIELQGISVGGFQVMLEYFYHGHITLLNENVQHCLEASRFFHVDWLTKVCCNFLTRHLSINNCLHILSLADTFCLSELAEDMYSFIGLNAGKLMDEGIVPQLSYEVLAELISGRYYIDMPEELLLSMVIDWTNADFKASQGLNDVEREQYLGHLLSHVKFHLMFPEQLDNIPEALLEYTGLREDVEKSRSLWASPHKWSTSTDLTLTGRGGREVIVLISEWDCDTIQMVDLNHPFLHQERFGLLDVEKLIDFTSIATIGDFLYAVGGYNMKLSPVNTMHLYDPRLRIWVPLCPMMHCRENFPVVNLTNKLYALGGSTLSSTELQPDSLTPVSEAGAQLGRPINMSSGISAAENQVDEPAEGAVVPIDSGAYQSTVPAAPPMTVCLRSCECYDPEMDMWSSIPSLPSGVYAHAACAHKGSLYVTGGVTDNLSDPVPVGYCYRWTPGDIEWTRRTSMLTRRQSHAMFSYQDRIYVMGGYTAGDLEDLSLGIQNCNKNEYYDAELDKWIEVMDTPEDFGHIHRSVTVVDDIAYLLGGTYSSKYLHELHLKSDELVRGAFCGKDWIKLCKLTMCYPRFMPSDAQIDSKNTAEP